MVCDIDLKIADEKVNSFLCSANIRKKAKEMLSIVEEKESGRSTEAIEQIAREKYAEGLYGYKQILCYGIAFYQKGAKVRKA